MAEPRESVIIGMAFELPGNVSDDDTFWDFCLQRKCATAPMPKSRFNAAQFYHPDRTRKGYFHVQEGAYLEQDVAVFDAPFFSLNEAEAKALDPQQRLLLQTTFLALENAGVTLEALSGRHDVGVFMAGSLSDYHERFNHDPFTASAYAGLGVGQTMNANRVSYFFNLKGPSINVDTACSSTLSALHLAVDSIQRGECTCAIVGASILQLSPEIIDAFASLGLVYFQGDEETC
jgi:acyl transferase domain-containing protein